MKNFKKNTLGLTLLIIGFIIATLGIAYAVMVVYDDITGTNNHSLVLGDIYMYYNETNQLSLENAMPSEGPDETKYFEFTISGKNTYTKQDIYYEIVLNHGETHQTRTERIKDSLLKFRLVEIKDNQETVVVDNQNYASLTNCRIYVNTISKNTTDEVDITYRLYMWISDDTVIGGGEAEYDYEMNTWNNDVFASIKVNVKGDFNEKVVINNASDFKTYILKEKQTTTITDTDGIVYISGEKDDYDPLTTDDVDYNYVWYSGKLWRITAIYPDGTMKMITDSNITTINWGSKSTVSSSDLTSAYSTSYMREWLNQEFLPTLYNYENIIVTDAGWYSITDSASTPIKPTGDYTLTDPVGLLNAYEYYMAYRNASTSTNYLNIVYDWWLITPYKDSVVRYVSGSGDLGNINPSRKTGGGRPVINLKSTIQLEGGSGTVSNPYRIKGDKEEAVSGTTLINTRTSGEYVKIEGDTSEQVFRIVDTEIISDSETSEEKLTTKIVLNDYVKESGSIITKYFSGSSSHELWTEVSASDATYWRGYLNTTWLSGLNTNMLEKGTYYLGYHTTGSYKTTVCQAVSSDISIDGCIENGTVVSNISNEDYVGLLRVGEMFASPTRDYTSFNAEAMWLITPYNSSGVRDVRNIGSLYNDNPNSLTIGGRPSINLKSTILIKSGSGTKQDPFVVGLPN